MALQKQIHVYSLDTSSFYNESERKIHNRMNEYYICRNKIKKSYKKSDKDKKTRLIHIVTKINKRLKDLKNKLYRLFEENKGVRYLYNNDLKPSNVVSVFESTLTRLLNININTLTENLFIVQIYFFNVMKDLILDGFIYNGEKYIYLTSSAGQIRTKKTVFIKESAFKKCQNSLLCGLSKEVINKFGGVNINKYLAYLALCNSATDLWEDFKIDRCIVVDDMETLVKSTVDFIDHETYEITRKEEMIPITHTDGCGMILPRLSNKSFMIRLPWVKGLLVPFPFDKFIEKYNGNPEIVDIYGKKHNIIDENIEIIFTKSQFKMYKFYKSWSEYCENFKKYNCQAGTCNEEDEFPNAKINYQMLQTLTNISNKELKQLAGKTINSINNISKDRNTMLRVMGVKASNTNKNYLQQALEIYPHLLGDNHIKHVLEQIKHSLVKQARSAKLDIDSVYTFICPDLYAFCEYLFLDNKNPNGLLKDGEVYCDLYKEKNKLDCLRSPHLYIEHCIRSNVAGKEGYDKLSDWFITDGLYTSCKDVISKILMFDNDGDKSLVCADELLIDIAEKHVKNVVPLFYNMKKAEAELITNESIYSSLINAYKGGNIGIISNDITKIFNSDKINEEAIKVVKWLCMENNFTIDYAKTLYKPKRPSEQNKIIRKYTKSKTPFFFMYAKDKERHQVEDLNNSTVNKLYKIIPNPRINFDKIDLGDFDYNMLIFNEYPNIDMDVVSKYKELDLKKYDMFNKKNGVDNYTYIYQDIRNKILEVNNDVQHVVYSLVRYLYKTTKTKNKTTLWNSFGDILVENLKYNVPLSYMYCEKCGNLTKRNNDKSHSQKYCKKCSLEMIKIRDRIRKSNKNST